MGKVFSLSVTLGLSLYRSLEILSSGAISGSKIILLIRLGKEPH